MALVVETGAGLADAEAYCSVAAADARHTAFGNTAWADLSTADKEVALRKATAKLTQDYRTRWKGERRTSAQALDWPRYGVRVECIYLANDTVPADIVNACADLAVKASSEDLTPDLERGIVREKVGPLETEYDRYSPQSKRYAAIDRALAPYMVGSSVMATLVRA
jgi:hypothetical protein